MAERTFDLEVSDEVGLVLPGGTHVMGGFTGRFNVVFEYDERPYVDAIELDVTSGNKRLKLDPTSELFKQVSLSILHCFSARIDEAWQQECASRARREEMSDRDYHRWQVL